MPSASVLVVVIGAAVTVLPLWRLGFFHGLPKDAPLLALLLWPILAPFTAALAVRLVIDPPFRHVLRDRWTARGGAR